VIVANKSGTYGSALPTLTGTVTGTVNGDTVGTTLTVSYSTTAHSTAPYSNAGTYPITATLGGAAAGNYIITTNTPGTLTINKAALTVTVANKSGTYGSALPTLTGTVTGTVNGDTVGTTLTVSYSTTAHSTAPYSNAGAYPITATLGGSSLGNYTITSNTPGTLTINKAVLSVKANNATRTFGQVNPSLTATITGYVNGDKQNVVSGSPSLTTEAISSSPVGSYAITASRGTLQALNYLFTFVNGSLTITQATPAIVWAPPAAITYGTALSSTQLDASSKVDGKFAYSPAAGTVLTAGTHTLSVTFTPTDNRDYTTAKASVTLKVNPLPSFAVSASPTSLTVAQGTSGKSTITVTSLYGFSGKVTLAVSGLPKDVTAVFATNPTSGTSVLTFTAHNFATTGTFTTTVKGTSGSLTASTTISLTVSK